MESLSALHIIISVMLVLFTIATFFLVSSLKKIEKIPAMEYKLSTVLERLSTVLRDLQMVIDKNHDFEMRLRDIERDVSRIETRLDNNYIE